MKNQTKECATIFAEVTGIKPLSARLGVGSMRGTIYIRVPHIAEVLAFIDHGHYYKKREHNFKGIEIKFIGSVFSNTDYHKKKGYEFIIELGEFRKYITV